MRRLLPALIGAIAALAHVPAARAEAPERLPELRRAAEQLHALDEEGALATLEAARAQRGLLPAELAQVYLLMGLAHAQAARQAEAEAHFSHALLLDAALRLPDDISPTVARWWRNAGGQLDAPAADPAPGPFSPAVPAPEEGRSWRPWASAGLAGAGAVALVAGLAVGAQARGLHRRAQEEERLISSAEALQGQAKAGAVTANVLFATGGALVVGAGVVWVFP